MYLSNFRKNFLLLVWAPANQRTKWRQMTCRGSSSVLFAYLSVFAKPQIPAFQLFSERVNTFKPDSQILG